MTYSDHMISFQQIGSHQPTATCIRSRSTGRWAAWPSNTSKSGGCWPRSCSSPPTKMAKAVETIAKEMEASRYHIRTPAFWDGLPGSYTQAFGMIKWYDMDLHAKYFAQQDAYLGLGFD